MGCHQHCYSNWTYHNGESTSDTLFFVEKQSAAIKPQLYIHSITRNNYRTLEDIGLHAVFHHFNAIAFDAGGFQILDGVLGEP